jgi:hypothetical protein
MAGEHGLEAPVGEGRKTEVVLCVRRFEGPKAAFCGTTEVVP